MTDTTSSTDPTVSHRADPATNPDTPTVSSINPTLVAVGGLVLGVLLLVLAFAKLNRMPRWADDHGAIWVYLGFFVYMSIAGRLTWWAIDTLREQATARGRR